MLSVLSINDKVKGYKRSRQLKRRYSLFVSVLCIVTATSVCSSLIMPAISTTDRMDYYRGESNEERRALGIDEVTTIDEDIIPTDEETTSDEVITARIAKGNILKGVNTEQTFSDYSIANILANYEIFISGDIKTTNHFTGAAAVGGKMNLGSHGGGGGGRLAPDYAGQLERSVIEDDTGLDPNIYYKEFIGYTDDDGNKVESFDNSNKPKQSDNYIDMEKAFREIQAESTAMSTDKTAKTLSSTTIKLSDDPTQNKFILPYSVLKDKEILIDATNYSGSLQHCGLTLSITGVGSSSVALGEYPNNVKMKYLNENGDEVTSDIRTACGGQRQYDFSGSNILFNFPDATGNIKMNEMAGHIVAPQADIEYKGGEGGAIGKTVDVSNEIHMFPYVAPQSKGDGKLQIEKKWQDKDGNEVSNVNKTAEIDVYRVIDVSEGNIGTEISADKISLSYDNTNSRATITINGDFKAGDKVNINFSGVSKPYIKYENSWAGMAEGINVDITSDTNQIEIKGIAFSEYNGFSEGLSQDEFNGLSAKAIHYSSQSTEPENPTESKNPLDEIENTVPILTLKLNKDNQWKALAENLALEDIDGNKFKYIIKEKDLDGFTAIYSDNNGSYLTADETITYTVTNKATGDIPQPENGKMIVRKIWLDPDEKECDLPEGYIMCDIYSTTAKPDSDGKVEHLQGASEVASDVKLCSDNGWETIRHFPLTDENGNTLYYYVVEDTKQSNITYDENIYSGWCIWTYDIERYNNGFSSHYDSSKGNIWYSIVNGGGSCSDNRYYASALLPIDGSKQSDDSTAYNNQTDDVLQDDIWKRSGDNKSSADIVDEDYDPTRFIIKNKLEGKEEYQLPNTGGEGTWKICTAGFSLAVLAATKIILKSRKRSEDDK